MKTFTASSAVPAGVEAAYAALTSERWPAAVAARLHDDSRVDRLDRTGDGGAVLVQSRAVPDGGPSFLRGLLPRGARVTQTDTWGPAGDDGSRRGTWEGALPGVPGRVHGTTALTPSGAGCTWTVTGEVTVRVPLVGAKAESFLADGLARLVETQSEVLRTLL